MIVNRIGQRNDDEVVYSVSGDVISINGVDYDFGPLGEGDSIFHYDVGCEFIKGVITRINGHIVLSLIRPWKSNPTEEDLNPPPEEHPL